MRTSKWLKRRLYYQQRRLKYKCLSIFSFLSFLFSLFCLFSLTLRRQQNPFRCLEFIKWIFSLYFYSFLHTYNSLCFFLWIEKESIQLQYLGRVEGENGFKVYLAFRRVSSESIFFLLRASGILYSLAWKHFIFLSKILSAFPRSFGDSFNTSGHSNCCPETRLCFFARSCGIRSPVLSRRPLSSKLHCSFLFPLTKRVFPALGFWPII